MLAKARPETYWGENALIDMSYYEKFSGRQHALSQFGDFVLDHEDIDEILAEGCRLVAAALGADLAKVIEIERDSNTGFIRAGIGWNPGIVGKERISLTEQSSEAYAIRETQPVITNDIGREDRFEFPSFLTDHGVVALVNVPIFLPGRIPWGILQVDAREPREFDQEDIEFLKTYSMVLGPVIDRIQLARERKATEALRAADFAALEELQRISAELVGDREPDVLYNRIVEAAAFFMQSDAASIQVLDPTANQLKLMAWRGFHFESAKFWDWVRADTGSSCGRALGAGERIIVPDMDQFDGELEDVEAYRRSNLLSVQSTPLRAFSGQVVGMLSTHWQARREISSDDCRHFDVLARLSADLIERIHATERLRDSESTLAAALESVPVGVAVMDLAGAAVVSNAEYRRFLPNAIIPSRDPTALARWQAWDSDGRAIDPSGFPIARALGGEAVMPGLEMLLIDPDGKETWTTVASVPIRDEQGRVTGAATAISDIDRAKRSAEALRVSEERLRQFGEASQDVLWIRDADRLQWQYLTTAFEAIYGLSRDKALSGDNFRNWLDLIVPADRKHAAEAIKRVHQGEYLTFDYRVRRPNDGAIRWLRDTDFPIADPDGKIRLIGGVGHDMTELREIERRLQVLMEGIPQLVWRAVGEGYWTWSSPQWRQYTGFGPQDSQGLGWLSAFHPEDHDALRTAWRDAQADGIFEIDARICRANDNSFRWFQTRASAVRDEAGAIIEWLGTSTDVHDMRELQERQKILVAELQHRTRNLMSVVRSVSDKTSRASANLSEFRARFRDQLEALSRVQGLLSRLNEHERVTFDELIHAELGSMNGTTDQVTLHGPKGVRLRSSAVQILAMALHELATNAVKYGALSQPLGRLVVHWTLETIAADDTAWLHIDWREKGVIIPPVPPARLGGGQGRELIERALPYQLRAKTSFKIESDGVHCTISMPISKTTRSPEVTVA